MRRARDTRIESAAAELLGKNVRGRREALAMSQEVLARAAKMDATRLSKLENGRAGDRGVGLATIARLAKALAVEPSDLLGHGAASGGGRP